MPFAKLEKYTCRRGSTHLWLLVNPVELGRLPAVDLILLEPEGNLLLCGLDAVGSVADVAANVDGEVTADGAWGAVLWVGGAKDDTAGLDGVTTLPDHGADWARGHVGDETGEERLGAQILVVLLEVLLGGGDELETNELEATVLEAGDDCANQAALNAIWLNGNEGLLRRHIC